ncbi:MAG TPA: hypothetical protein VLU54_16090, partial [Casimicrobiaceae bacterium]|nr:hypothetical protein [Casimicrobiaceae bacterium]
APARWTAGSDRVTASQRQAANESAARGPAAADGEDATAMTHAQRAALSAMIHSPATRRTSRWKRRDRVGDVVWALVLALLLGLSVDSLFEGLRFVHSADALRTLAASWPHVDELATRGQSSGVFRRTM